jgi:hypothetical protein
MGFGKQNWTIVFVIFQHGCHFIKNLCQCSYLINNVSSRQEMKEMKKLDLCVKKLNLCWFRYFGNDVALKMYIQKNCCKNDIGFRK